MKDHRIWVTNMHIRQTLLFLLGLAIFVLFFGFIHYFRLTKDATILGFFTSIMLWVFIVFMSLVYSILLHFIYENHIGYVEFDNGHGLEE